MSEITLTTSDIINLGGIIASLVVSSTAVWISIKSLRQNAKMIEESTRPNIQIYPLYIDSILYLIVKNFGTSEAYIDKIECSHKFSPKETFGNRLGEDIFSGMHGALFCPGYAVRCPLIAYNVEGGIYDFYLKYHSSTKTYESTFSFNPLSNAPFADIYPSSNTTDQHLQNIAKGIHDIVKINL